MTLRHLEVFVAVCQFSSITKAAQTLNVSQPAVSRIVSAMEDYYSVRLFDRISKRLHVTESGKHLLSYAQRILTLFHDMEEDIRNHDGVGTLRVGATATVASTVLPECIRVFSDQFPKVDVRVSVTRSRALSPMLTNNEIDIALIEREIRSSQIHLVEFHGDRLTVVCPVGHAFCRRSSVSIAELADQRFLLKTRGSTSRDVFDAVMITNGISIEPAWESENSTALAEAVVHGLGISVLPFYQIKAFWEDGRLGIVNLEGIDLSRKYYIAYHKDKHLTDVTRTFIDLSLRKAAILAGLTPVAYPPRDSK